MDSTWTRNTALNLSHADLPYLRDKLLAMVHREMRLADVVVAADRNLAEYGLDSIVALTIAGDLEEELGIELPPTLLWDYPTINDLAGYLASLAPRPAGDAA